VGQKSAYYTHPSSWKEGVQQNLYDLGILHEMELLSTNEELKTLVENPSQCIPAGGRYSDYVSQALQEVMVKVNILLRNVALLFPEVYRLFINEALQRALVGHTSLDESDIMPRRC